MRKAAILKTRGLALMNNKIYPTYFAFGAIILYSLLFVLPGLLGIAYSFTDWTAFSDEVSFVGLRNFRMVFSSDGNYLKYLNNTILFTFVTTIVKNIIGLTLAIILTRKVLMLNLHRTIMYIPAVLSALIVGMIFKSVLNPRDGLLNGLLSLFSISGPRWLTDPNLAIWSVMGVDTWKGMGYIMTIFIAGIMSISPTYYEAADIDGANAWQKFRAITLPMLMPTITITTVLNIIYGLRVFDMVFSLTNGGPGFATEVLYTSIYKEFSFGRYAVGTTLSSIMFVFMVAVGYFLIRVMTKSEVPE